MATLKVHGVEVRVSSALIKEYEERYGTGQISDIEDVLNELVKEDSSNMERDVVRKLEWAVRQVEGKTVEEARKRLEEMMNDGEDHGIERQ